MCCCNHGIDTERRQDTLAARLTHPLTPLRIRQQVEQHRRESVGVRRGNEMTRDAIHHDFGIAPNVRGHGGQAVRHGFQQAIRDSLPEGGSLYVDVE